MTDDDRAAPGSSSAEGGPAGAHDPLRRAPAVEIAAVVEHGWTATPATAAARAALEVFLTRAEAGKLSHDPAAVATVRVVRALLADAEAASPAPDERSAARHLTHPATRKVVDGEEY